jgi:predicted short-subunit dehydrogenase-like oxidoreductase (DUF2520 family)
LAAKKNIKIKVLVIGSGNIGWHIVSHLSFFKRFDITVFNRTLTPNLKQLQKEFKVSIVTDWKKVNKETELFFICTSDSAIKPMASKIKKLKSKGFVIHTSGTAPLKAISTASKNIGVFYPLQTFTFGQSVFWPEVPVFVEASDAQALHFMDSFGKLFSNTVVKLNSDQRLKLHLAAVIAGNFSNAMYTAANNFTDKELGKEFFKYLIPLIVKTAKKTRSVSPVKAQTGPAVRGDKNTQKQHLQLLKKYPDLKKIYKSISKLIEKQQKGNAKLQRKTK